MPHRKKPDGTSRVQALNQDIFDTPEGRRLMREEIEKLLKDNEVIEAVTQYLEISTEAKADPKGKETVLEKSVLGNRDLLMLVLRTEHVIAGVVPAAKHAGSLLRSNLTPDHNRRPRFDRQGINGGRLSAASVHDDLLRILRIAEVEMEESGEHMIKPPPISIKQRRIVADKGVPHGVRKREIPILNQDIVKVIYAFAADNAIATLNDTHALRDSAHAAQGFFEDEMDLFLQTLESSQQKGFDPEALKRALEGLIKGRTGVFQDTVLRFDTRLRVTGASMSRHGRRNKLLTDKIKVEHITRLRRELTDGRRSISSILSAITTFVSRIPIIGRKHAEHHKGKHHHEDKAVLDAALERRRKKR